MIEIKQMYAILSRLPILQGMNGRDLALIQEMANEVHYTAQLHPKPFIHAHTICNMLYFLAVGSLIRRITSPDGRFVMEEVLSAPAIIEPESLYGLQCTFCCDYMAHTDATLLVLSKQDAALMVARNDIFRMNLLNHLSAHIQRLREQQMRPSPNEVWMRIGYMISDMSISPVGTKTLRTKMDELAEHLHETRLTISRTLGMMEKHGLVELRRREITVPDMKKLATCLTHGTMTPEQESAKNNK